MERVKKLKVEQARTRHKMSADLDACTRIFVESLLNMCDPYVRGRFSTYKQMAVKKQGLTFLQRMEKDSDVRNTVSNIINAKLDIDSLKNIKRQNSLKAGSEFDERAIEECLSPVKRL